MKEKQYKKIHFEIVSDASKYLIHKLFGTQSNFCDMITMIHENLRSRGEKTTEAFEYDKACQAYLDGIYRKTYNQSLFDQDIETIRAAFWEVYTPYLFSLSGKKTFRLSKDLTHMLMDTDLRKVDSFF